MSVSINKTLNIIIICNHCMFNCAFYCFRKPKLPIEMEYLPVQVSQEIDWDADVIIDQAERMQQLKEKITESVQANIEQAEKKDKMYYDKKHRDQRASGVNAILLCRGLES